MIQSLTESQFDKIKTVKTECDQICAQIHENSLIYYQDNTVVQHILILLNQINDNFLNHVISIRNCAENNKYANATDSLNGYIKTIGSDMQVIYADACERIRDVSSRVFGEELQKYNDAKNKIEEEFNKLEDIKVQYQDKIRQYNNTYIPSDHNDPSYQSAKNRKDDLRVRANRIAFEFNRGVANLKSFLTPMIELLDLSLKITDEGGNSKNLPPI